MTEPEVLTGDINERQSGIAQRRLLMLNEKYFDGALRDYRVLSMKNLCCSGSPTAGYHRGKEMNIYICAGIRGAALTAILLHEMAHASANDYHAKKWMEEMERLVCESGDDEQLGDALRRDLGSYKAA